MAVLSLILFSLLVGELKCQNLKGPFPEDTFNPGYSQHPGFTVYPEQQAFLESPISDQLEEKVTIPVIPKSSPADAPPNPRNLEKPVHKKLDEGPPKLLSHTDEVEFLQKLDYLEGLLRVPGPIPELAGPDALQVVQSGHNRSRQLAALVNQDNGGVTHDQKSVESVCLALSRLVEGLQSDPPKLLQIASTELLTNLQQLVDDLLTGTNNGVLEPVGDLLGDTLGSVLGLVKKLLSALLGPAIDKLINVILKELLEGDTLNVLGEQAVHQFQRDHVRRQLGHGSSKRIPYPLAHHYAHLSY